MPARLNLCDISPQFGPLDSNSVGQNVIGFRGTPQELLHARGIRHKIPGLEP